MREPSGDQSNSYAYRLAGVSSRSAPLATSRLATRCTSTPLTPISPAAGLAAATALAWRVAPGT